jgi:hypothetical protein
VGRRWKGGGGQGAARRSVWEWVGRAPDGPVSPGHQLFGVGRVFQAPQLPARLVAEAEDGLPAGSGKVGEGETIALAAAACRQRSVPHFGGLDDLGAGGCSNLRSREGYQAHLPPGNVCRVETRALPERLRHLGWGSHVRVHLEGRGPPTPLACWRVAQVENTRFKHEVPPPSGFQGVCALVCLARPPPRATTCLEADLLHDGRVDGAF